MKFAHIAVGKHSSAYHHNVRWNKLCRSSFLTLVLGQEKNECHQIRHQTVPFVPLQKYVFVNTLSTHCYISTSYFVVTTKSWNAYHIKRHEQNSWTQSKTWQTGSIPKKIFQITCHKLCWAIPVLKASNRLNFDEPKYMHLQWLVPSEILSHVAKLLSYIKYTCH